MSRLIGIDVGSRYTKVVELEPGPKPCLINAFLFATPGLTTQEKKVSTGIDLEQFRSRISKIIPPKRLRAAKIAVSLPSDSIDVMISLLPKMSKRELATAAVSEARRMMIPASHPNSVFEYCIFGERIVAKIPRYEILTVRTEKRFVENALGLFKDISPLLITPVCFAAFSALDSSAWSKEEVGFVDIGYKSTGISIAKGGRLCFYRNIAFGFKDIILNVSQELGIDEQRAEQVLKEKGVPEVDFDIKDRVAVAEEIMRQKYETSLKKAEAADEINILELRMRWQSAIERITQEIRRSFAYYKEQSEGGRVEQIFFFGGGGRVSGLIPALSKGIGGECRILSPFRKMEVALEYRQFEDIAQEGPIFASATGLALGILAKKKEVINFLPAELKTREVTAFRYMILMVVIIFLIMGFSVGWLNMLFISRSLRISLNSEKSELSRIAGLMKEHQGMTEQRRNLDENIRLVRSIEEQSPEFRFLLYEIVSFLPVDVVLTEIAIQAKGASFDQQDVSFAEGQEEGALSFEGGLPSAVSGEEAIPGGQRRERLGKEEKEYTLKIEARITADYERTLKIIEDFRKGLLDCLYIKEVEIKPPKLEKMSPRRIAGREEFILTEVKERQFSLTAEIQLR